MTSGRTSKLIRELDRMLIFGEYVSSKCSDEPAAPMIFACVKFESGRLLDELLQRKVSDQTKQVLIQARGVMKWGYNETDHAV